MLFDGYVLENELYCKAKVSRGLFRQFKCVDLKKMGGLNVVKINTLPKKYLPIADECLELSRYISFKAFCRMIGASDDYLHNLIRYNKNIKVVRVYRSLLIELSDEFIALIKSGKTPHLYKKYDDEYYEMVLDMYGIRIGFY